MSSVHRTLSGGLAVEDGDSGATVDGAGDAFSWGPRGALLLSELEATSARVPTEPAPTAVILNDGGDGLMPGAREQLAEDGIAPARRGRRTGTPEYQAAVERARRQLDPRSKGRTADSEQATREASEVLGRRKGRGADHDEQVRDAEARLTRRPGEPARRHPPADQADWKGAEVEAEEAREAIGDVGLRPKTEPPQRPQGPASGSGWRTLKSSGRRRKAR